MIYCRRSPPVDELSLPRRDRRSSRRISQGTLAKNTGPMTGLAIHYRREFFGETTNVVSAASALTGSSRPGSPRGLVGRQVANAEMLSALLRYGRDELVTFLVDSESDLGELSRPSVGCCLPTRRPSSRESVRLKNGCVDVSTESSGNHSLPRHCWLGLAVACRRIPSRWAA